MQKLLAFIIINTSLAAMESNTKRRRKAALNEQIHTDLFKTGMNAALRGDSKSIQILLPSLNLNQENELHETILTKAAQANSLALIELLLATRSIFMNSQGSIQAVLWAAQLGNVSIVRTLIDAGISVNCQDAATGYTPLMIAIFKNHTDVIALLLSHSSIDISLLNGDGDTAYSLAVNLNRPCISHILTLLLQEKIEEHQRLY